MTLTWTFIGFVLCGFVCMWTFQQKRRSLLRGFLLGLFLGLIGVIIALSLSEKEMPNYTSFLRQTEQGWQWQKADQRYNRGNRQRSTLTTPAQASPFPLGLGSSSQSVKRQKL